jgi:hypothetical protein
MLRCLQGPCWNILNTRPATMTEAMRMCAKATLPLFVSRTPFQPQTAGLMHVTKFRANAEEGA